MRPALRIALIYLTIAIFWIIFSDRIAAWLFQDINTLNTVQSIKGLAFVFGTAALLGWLLHIEIKRHDEARQHAEQLNRNLNLRNHELTTLHQVISSLGKTRDLNEIYAIMFREIAQKLFNVPHFAVALYDPDADSLECRYVVVDNAVSDAAAFPKTTLNNGPISQSIRQRESRIIDVMALKQHGDIPEIDIDDQRDSQVALYLPLMSGDKVVGITLFLHHVPTAFDNINIQFVLTLAYQLATELENAILFEQVQRHAEELEHRVAERTEALTKANKHLQQLDRLKSKFIADVTHDLRGPVASMLMRVDLLERITPEKRDQYVAGLRDQIMALKKLVDDILDLSQLDMSEFVKLTLQPVDVNGLLEQIVATYSPIAQHTELAMVFMPGEDVPLVWGESNQISRMMSNLVTNAINYTKQGEIRISTGVSIHNNRRHVCMKVQDTGSGIDPEDLPHLFERFYRGAKTAQEITGTGLGLSIVKEIVDLHRGQIDVSSQPGQGSTFVVYLPTADMIATGRHD